MQQNAKTQYNRLDAKAMLNDIFSLRQSDNLPIDFQISLFLKRRHIHWLSCIFKHVIECDLLKYQSIFNNHFLVNKFGRFK